MLWGESQRGSVWLSTLDGSILADTRVLDMHWPRNFQWLALAA